jgi:hypothetical protein
MAHLLHLLSGCVLVYAGVTRGSLVVAHGFERLARLGRS